MVESEIRYMNVLGLTKLELTMVIITVSIFIVAYIVIQIKLNK